MPQQNGTFQPRDSDEIRADLVTELQTRIDDPATDENDLIGALFSSIAATLASQQEQSLAQLYENQFIQFASGEELTRRCRELGVIRDPATKATGVVRFERDSTATQDYVITEGTRLATEPPNQVVFETTETVTFASGTQQTTATVQAVTAGTDGNVPAGKITIAPNGITGVDSLVNPDPIGDPAFTDTNGNTLIVGRDRESDEALRERTLEAVTSIGGAATLPAIRAALTNVEGVRAQNVYVDQTNDTIEPVVFGGSDAAVANALHESVTATAETVGGVNGTGVSVTVDEPLLPDGQRTINFSRPQTVAVDITVDVVVDASFVGATAIQRQLVEYVGGTRPDGTLVNGVSVGEDIFITELEQTVEDDDNGVVGVTNIATTPATTTNANGLEIVSVASNEVAQTDATDGSITVNVTQQ